MNRLLGTQVPAPRIKLLPVCGVGIRPMVTSPRAAARGTPGKKCKHGVLVRSQCGVMWGQVERGSKARGPLNIHQKLTPSEAGLASHLWENKQIIGKVDGVCRWLELSKASQSHV